MSKPTSSTSVPYDFSQLSDEDINLLYTIIQTAEALPSTTPPFRALFTAYDRVLRQHGIEKDHDQIYFRFLLRLGETKGEGLDFFERFEKLLGEVGVEIRFDGEDGYAQSRRDEEGNSGERRRTSGASVVSAVRESKGPRSHAEAETGSARRRASFDSAYETNGDSRIDGVVPSPPRPHSTDVMQGQHGRFVRTSQAPRPQPSSRNKDHNVAPPSRGRLRQREVAKPHNALPRRVSISRPRDGYTEAGRGRLYEQDAATTDYASEGSEELDQAGPELGGRPPYPLPAQQLTHLTPATDQLETYAKQLRYAHTAAHALTIFHLWRHRAITLHNTHIQLYQVAAHHDARTLVRQAFDQWHTTLLHHRHDQETERFFAALEAKAAKARDLFLLTKAFTHWAAAAEEQVVRSNVARRHILRTRYFNAWRDITVVNELKVRRARLQKFVNVWKRKTIRVLDLKEQAQGFLEHSMVASHYRHWFWHFCERRAPTWYNSKLKSALFARWLDGTRQGHVREEWAGEFRSLELVRSATAKWSGRTGVVLRKHEQAELFRRKKLIEPVVEALGRELVLAPLEARMLNVVDSRIARESLRVWVQRVRASAQAGCVRDMRVLRTTWTKWNDRLRCQALSRTIDDRIVVQALYRWVLAERLKLFERVRNEKLRTRVFTLWHTRMDKLCAGLGRAKHLMQLVRHRRLTSVSLYRWSSRSTEVMALDNHAEAVMHHKLRTSSLSSWTSRLNHLQQIETWARDARFFVLASRSVKQWQASTVAHQRNRRRDAYSTVRRKTKTGLARKLLLRWQSRRVEVASLHEIVEQRLHQRVVSVLPSIIGTWRVRTAELHQRQYDALTFNAHSLLSTTFMVLLSQHSHQLNLHFNATTFRTATISDMAASCMRKLNWAVFQIKRQEETAESLAERNRRKHYKGMLRYWRDGAKKRRRPVDRRLFQSVIGSSTGRAADTGVQADGDVEFEEDLIEFSTLTPMPARYGVNATPAAVTSAFPAALPTTATRRPPMRTQSQRRPFVPSSARSQLQTQNQSSEFSEEATTTPGYLRTPSRRAIALRTGNLPIRESGHANIDPMTNRKTAPPPSRLHQLRQQTTTAPPVPPPLPASASISGAITAPPRTQSLFPPPARPPPASLQTRQQHQQRMYSDNAAFDFATKMDNSTISTEISASASASNMSTSVPTSTAPSTIETAFDMSMTPAGFPGSVITRYPYAYQNISQAHTQAQDRGLGQDGQNQDQDSSYAQSQALQTQRMPNTRAHTPALGMPSRSIGVTPNPTPFASRLRGLSLGRGLSGMTNAVAPTSTMSHGKTGSRFARVGAGAGAGARFEQSVPEESEWQQQAGNARGVEEEGEEEERAVEEEEEEEAHESPSRNIASGRGRVPMQRRRSEEGEEKGKDEDEGVVG